MDEITRDTILSLSQIFFWVGVALYSFASMCSFLLKYPFDVPVKQPHLLELTGQNHRLSRLIFSGHRYWYWVR